MFDLIFKAWFLIAIMPLFILMEVSEWFGKLLKKKKIYDHWDMWHAFLFLLILAYIVIYFYKLFHQ
jgi:hypothetical protein